MAGEGSTVGAKVSVEIEERQLGDRRWAVIIHRPSRILARTLWERYETQRAAQRGAEEARTYLTRRGEL